MVIEPIFEHRFLDMNYDHLVDADLKGYFDSILSQKVAGIGSVLRHNYENIAAPVMWKLARDNLDALEQVCRAELDAAAGRNRR